MLETKDLCKIYRPKKGQPVTALDKVTLKFPEKGMVFLLGKSGSGKSTLLNVLGGLDNYNSGEIIIKGVSSKNFRQRHFDSYRNTYVGFIFQEYNVLDEFSVGANIALAIELQGRKASDEEINRILDEVDLSGFGNRKPNELSGGQKQRVAIARALVKSPEIIMADEPTGALDSNTGRQVFETLKKLSADKLVIVVSHDREFAELYADRIIELSDGRVISDVEQNLEYTETVGQELSFIGDTVEIPSGYHLTEQDREAINNYIDELKQGGAKLKISSKSTSSARFKPTDTSKISYTDNKGFRLIKSKLPLKNAFKMGASGLKHKKFRLVMTVLLSCISFGLFGLADTFSAYNHINTCTNSIIDSKIDYASVIKSKKVGKGSNAYWREYSYKLSDENITELAENTGVRLEGVFMPRNASLNFENSINMENYNDEVGDKEFRLYNLSFNGFTEISDGILLDLGYKMVAGRIPEAGKDEIVISKYIFDVIKKFGYTDGTVVKDASGKETVVYTEIKSYVDLLTKPLSMNNKKYSVVGIVDTNFDLSRYEHLNEKKEHISKAEQLINYALYSEYRYYTGYSLTCTAMVGEGSIAAMVAAEPKIYNITNGHLWFYGNSFDISADNITTIDCIDPKNIVWFDGAKTTLGDKEIIISESGAFHYYDENGATTSYTLEDGTTDYKTLFAKNTVSMNGHLYYTGDSINEEGYKVVGIIPAKKETEVYGGTVIVSDRIFNIFADKNDGWYNFAVGSMPKDKTDIKKLVAYCYNEEGTTRFPLQNSVTYELDMVNEGLKEFAKIFLYVGLGFALFAAVMLANFIGTSISYKKQEIGILRAIGSRSNDVFRIFFAESFIIAMINFVLSSIGVFVVTSVINYVIRTEIGILITILTFSIRQVLLLLAVSILVAFIASFLPVKRIASKRPIDAIRDR